MNDNEFCFSGQLEKASGLIKYPELNKFAAFLLSV
jgi:hypothetical protein